MPHNMVNFCPLTAEIRWRVWGTPANFYRFCVLASLLHRRRYTQLRSTKLCRMFGCLLGWYTIYTFWGLLPPNGIHFASNGRSLALSYTVVAWYKEWNYRTSAEGRRTRHVHASGKHHTIHWNWIWHHFFLQFLFFIYCQIALK